MESSMTDPIWWFYPCTGWPKFSTPDTESSSPASLPLIVIYVLADVRIDFSGLASGALTAVAGR